MFNVRRMCFNGTFDLDLKFKFYFLHIAKVDQNFNQSLKCIVRCFKLKLTGCICNESCPTPNAATTKTPIPVPTPV